MSDLEDLIRAMKAEAWDEGWNKGVSHGLGFGGNSREVNPYRTEGERDG